MKRNPNRSCFSRSLRCEPLEDRRLLSAYYVDATGGNDSWNGQSATYTSGTTGPWKTLAKVNASTSTTRAGDSVLFKRGEVWHGQLTTDAGSSSGRVTYGAYGDTSLPKPQILGSVEEDSPSNWTNVGTNLWKTASVPNSSYGVGNVIYNNGESCGYDCPDLATLASRQTQGDWYIDSSSYVTVYSTAIPSSYYSDIEMAVCKNVIQGGSYVTIQNLDLRYGGFHGIQFVSKTNVTVADCDVSFMGGAGTWDWRLGNGIEFYGSAAYALIERCNIWNIWDSGISQQGDNSSQVEHDMTFRNNVIGKCDYTSYEAAWLSSSTAQIYNIHFENNTSLCAGMGWTLYQHRHNGWTTYGIHVWMSLDASKVSSFYVRNNIFYETTGALICVRDNAQPGMTVDYNAYYTSGAYVGDCWGHSYDMAGFAMYQAFTGYDAHSLAAPIGMADPANGNYRLAATSPAIDIGLNTGLATDFAGTARPQGPGYDIGAYEYVYTAPTVTINQAAGQADPTASSPVNFTVVFSEPVSDFVTGEITFTGTAPGTLVGTVTGSGTTYNVAISGMTGEGTVIPRILAGVAHDAAGNASLASTSTDNTVIYDPTPVTILSTLVNDGDAQRSKINRLVVTLSEVVTLDTGAFAVIQKGTGTSVGVTTSAAMQNGRSVVTLTFGGALLEYGSLKDGEYRLTVDGSKVHDADTGTNLDGDADGAFGGNYLFGAATADRFFRKFGDADGDRDVDAADLLAFKRAYAGTYKWYLDFDGDGDIDAVDLLRFKQRYA
jgi:hypothetical protein